MKALCSFIFLTLLTLSCDSKVADENTCDIEAMRCYRGFPHSCDFVKKCKEVDYKFTKSRCEKVFKSLYTGANAQSIISEHTNKILHCFNDREFENFNIDKSLKPKE